MGHLLFFVHNKNEENVVDQDKKFITILLEEIYFQLFDKDSKVKNIDEEQTINIFNQLEYVYKHFIIHKNFQNSINGQETPYIASALSKLTQTYVFKHFTEVTDGQSREKATTKYIELLYYLRKHNKQLVDGTFEKLFEGLIAKI